MSMHGLFERLFKIRPEEFRLTQAFFCYYTCIGMLYTLGATVGDSLFLTHVAPARVDGLLAWVYVGIAVATVGAAWIFNVVQDRLRRIVLIVSTQLLLALTVIAFRLVLAGWGAGTPWWIYFGLIIWLEVCALLSVMLFYSFAGDYFTTRAAKRLYGYIVGGLALGNVLGGLAVGPVVALIGTANLLYGVVVLLCSGAALSIFIHRIGEPVQGASSDGVTTPVPMRNVLQERYIQLIFAAVLLGLACFVLVDYQMKITAKNTYTSASELAGFFGAFYSYAGVTQLVFQFLLVGVLLRHLGIVPSLMILPVAHAAGASLFYATGHGIMATHALFIIAAANYMRMTLTETLEAPARELSLLPLPTRVRLRAQSMMGGMLVPIGQGVGGLLIVGLALAGFALFEYSLFVLGGVGLWIVALLFLMPRYRQTLATSLSNNQLDATAVDDLTGDSRSEHVLGALLTAENEQVTLYTLELLRSRELGPLSRMVRLLANDPREKVAEHALSLLGADGDPEHLPTIEQAAASESEAIRRAAVLAGCRLLGEEAPRQRQAWLEDPSPEVRAAAIVGFGKYGGAAGAELIRPLLRELAASRDPDERIRVAELLGKLGDRRHESLIERLIKDRDLSVRSAAIDACGELGLVRQVDRLLDLCLKTELAPRALAALRRLPEEAAPSIGARAADSELDENLRSMLFQVLADVGGRAAQDLLWGFFCTAETVVLRVAAGRTLQLLATQKKLLARSEYEYELRLDELGSKISLLNQAQQQFRKEDVTTRELFGDHTRLEIKCLLQLLSCRHDPSMISRVDYNLESANASQRANALELLDSLLPRRIAPKLVALLDSIVEKRPPDGVGLTPEMAKRLADFEPWLTVVARFSAGQGAQRFLQLRAPAQSAVEQDLALQLLRIAYLRKVPLFAEVGADYLIRLARMAEPVDVAQGEVLFCEGDQGNAMYLLQHGSMRLAYEDGELESQLHSGDTIGVMSVIDGLPRSATCRAVQGSSLLRISVQDFQTLVRSHISFSLAVLRSLSGRLREQMALLQGAGDED